MIKQKPIYCLLRKLNLFPMHFPTFLLLHSFCHYLVAELLYTLKISSKYNTYVANISPIRSFAFLFVHGGNFPLFIRTRIIFIWSNKSIYSFVIPYYKIIFLPSKTPTYFFFFLLLLGITLWYLTLITNSKLLWFKE